MSRTSAGAPTDEAEQAEEGQTLPEQDRPHEDVAEEWSRLPLLSRRRPSGERSARAKAIGIVDVAWIALAITVGICWAFATARGSLFLFDRIDAAVLREAEPLRSSLLTSLARVITAVGGVWVILALRWGTIVTLVIVRRLRALMTFVASVLILRIGVAALAQFLRRPTLPGVTSLTGFHGTSPSEVMAALSVTLGGMAYALLPSGTKRRIFAIASATLILLVMLARIELGAGRPSGDLVGVVFGASVAVLAFRIFCHEDTFPVTYSTGRAAHLEIDEPRRHAIREALEERASLELVEIEPFGDESSGGSTPLRLEVRQDGRTEVRFAKLYSEVHLRADRFYKLWRTIAYGELEDEAAFDSVRRLVEYEDYMLRVMAEAGVPGVGPRGFIEIEPEREYLLMSTFLPDAKEADEGKELSDAAIEAGLRIVRTLWDSGLAHRDIKPGNVLVRGERVYLIDLAFGQVQPSEWRQAVDLANMMLVLALRSTPERVFDKAQALFTEDEIGEAFSAANGPAIPRQLRQSLREDGRDLLGAFRDLTPGHSEIAIQRWSLRRLALTVRTAAIATALAVLVLINLANPSSP